MHITHWGRVMHICVSNLTSICSDNGLSPGRHQAIIWTNAGILLIRPLGTNLWNINRNSYIFTKYMHLKMSSGKRWPFCLRLDVLSYRSLSTTQDSSPHVVSYHFQISLINLHIKCDLHVGVSHDRLTVHGVWPQATQHSAILGPLMVCPARVCDKALSNALKDTISIQQDKG